MAKRYSASKTTDGIMIFTNGFVNPSLAFSTTGGYNSSNVNDVKFKLGINAANGSYRPDSEFSLDAIKTKFFRENTQIKNSRANVTATVSNNSEYYPHLRLHNGQGGLNPDERYMKNGFIENPFAPTPDIMFGMNNYRFKYKSKLQQILDLTKEPGDKEVKPVVSVAEVRPAMFNPLYMISVNGLTNNVPLLNSPNSLKMGSGSSSMTMDENITDCSIRELVNLSHQHNSILGVAKYRYADFMYCKDLGKVSNNHLITLRVFPFPVGDHIQHLTSPKFRSEYFSFVNTGDIGRLVTWFGTDDNKLEDILKYDFHASWKELNAQIEEVKSQEDDQARGPLGMLINTFSPQYNKAVGAGTAGNQSLWKYIGGDKPTYANHEILGNYDKNKVYEPKDTIQSTHTYEGKLEFTHEFTLNFSYKLRAYDNINPKSAFLDLLGNITAVTYRRGHFWGGDRKFIGPQQNTAAYQKANKLIDKKFEEAGSIFSGLLTNGLNFASLLGSLSGLVGIGQQLIQGARDYFAGKNDGKDVGGAVNTIVQELNDKFNFTDALKGGLKNILGRPALYAMQSLLSGDDVGLWHVTIGNPKNPIASIGNLILTNASVTHSGPLGIDDFPTELRVSVTLKHARGRDAVDIQKMYTGGVRSLYSIPRVKDINQFYGSGNLSEYVTVKTDENGNEVETLNESKYYSVEDAKAGNYVTANNTKIDSTDAFVVQNSYDFQNAAANIKLQGVPNSNYEKSLEPKDILINDSQSRESEHFNQQDIVMIHRVMNEIR